MATKNYLRAAREEANLTLEAASEKLSVAGVDLSAGQLSRLERGESELTRPRLRQLSIFYNWTEGELLAGRNKYDDDGRPRGRVVPLIDTVQAGHWTEVADPYPKGEAHKWVPAPSHVGPRAFALELDGPSMEPEFHDGDTVIFDPDVAPKPGHYVVARIDDDNTATFKKYHLKGHDAKGRPIVDLVPLNPAWPILSLNSRKGGRIVAVATDHYRRLV
ncbi:helix-turn-helix domain-containing protein [Reyranella sp.]|uniref:helix-turn-helix domain-containing protein n=1 Tax=Reyranella sp. TaxID=1929291 RepID=UPI003C7984AB